MNPDGGYHRMGAPSWHRSNTVEGSYPNARGQSSSFPRYPPPGLPPLNPSTSNSQVPFITPANYSSGDVHSFPTEVGLPLSSAVGLPYASAGGNPYSPGGGQTYSSGGSHTYPSGSGLAYPSTGHTHTYSSGGHTTYASAGHAFPPGGHSFPSQAHSTTFPPYVSPFKCPDCYSMGSELFYCKTQHEIISNKYKAELQQHALCGPKFASYEAKIEELKKYEPRIQNLEKDLNEAKGFREKCKNLQSEVDILQDECRKLHAELDQLNNASMNNNFFLRQNPGMFSLDDGRQPHFNPNLPHVFDVNRRSHELRSDNVRLNHHPNDGRENNRPSRAPRYPQEEAPREVQVIQVQVPRPVRPRVVLREIEGDLFDMSNEFSLAHCVGSDFIMSSGVAIKFRKQFRCIPELLDQNKGPGEVAFLTNSGRFIYYLVTKESSTGKPTVEDFRKAVKELRKLCEEHGVTKLAIPKIGCGRDQLDWNDVKRLLNEEFAQTSVDITVCVIYQETLPDKRWNLKLVHAKHPLSELCPTECALVFIASKDGALTPAIQNLAQKYNFMSDYESFPKSLGGLYHYTTRGGNINIFGLIVKDHKSDPFSFTKFCECLLSLRRAMKKVHLYYIGLEAFDETHITCVTRKIWTTLIDCFFTDDYEIHICWPNNIREKPWEERK